jgi:glycosyltransferase involved in cell wall biosynthesis
MPTASLVISTYNWPQALELVLLSAKRQSTLPGEVIVADDGSGEETRKLIEGFQKDFPVPLHHVWHEDNGFQKSIILNKAIAKAKGEYIIAVDGDMIMERHFVEDHLALSEPNVFVYGKRVKLKESILSLMFRKKKIRFNFFSAGVSKRGRTLRIPYLADKYEANDFRYGAVRGCNISFWRGDFIKVNGYNEEMTGWGKEDTELTHRFFNNGMLGKNVKYRAIAYHIYHKDTSRERDVINTAIQQKTIDDNIKAAPKGISQYL